MFRTFILGTGMDDSGFESLLMECPETMSAFTVTDPVTTELDYLEHFTDTALQNERYCTLISVSVSVLISVSVLVSVLVSVFTVGC